MIKKLFKFIVVIVVLFIALGIVGSLVGSPDTTESPSNEVTKAEPVVSSSPPVQPKKPDPNLKFGLTEGQRKSLFQEIVKAQDEADKRAEKKYPADAVQKLKAGEMFILTKETP